MEKKNKNKEVYLREDQIRRDTEEDFKRKDIDMESFPSIRQGLSNDDFNLYYESLSILQEKAKQIIKKLQERHASPESAIMFIKHLNEVAKNKNAK